MFLDSVSSLSYVILIFLEDTEISANVLLFWKQHCEYRCLTLFLSGFLFSPIFYHFQTVLVMQSGYVFWIGFLSLTEKKML